MNRVLLGAVALLTLAACGGSTGPAGAQGAQGDPGPAGPAGPAGSNGTTTASVSGITPDHVFLARSAEVTLSGFGTNWSSATTVDFGAGVTVKKLTVASPTALVADITIDKAAAMGPRDVTVKDSSGSTTYTNGFKVSSPVVITYESVPQGSIVTAHVKNLDVANPFDTTSTTDPNTFQTTYTNLNVVPGNGVEGIVTNANYFDADVQLFVDTTATGMVDFDLLSGAPTSQSALDYVSPKGVNITPRMATALTAGTPVMDTIANPMDSALYQYTPEATSLAIVDFTATPANANASPVLYLLPKSGAWADMLTGAGATQTNPNAVATWLTSSTDPVYAVFYDPSGATGSSTISVTSTPPALTAPTTSNDGTIANAVPATAFPFVLTNGSLSTAHHQDYVKITTGAADGGKTLTLYTICDSKTDLNVQLLQSDGTTQILGGDVMGAASGSTAATASTTYYLGIGTGQAFDPAHGSYQVILKVQ